MPFTIIKLLIALFDYSRLHSTISYDFLASSLKEGISDD